MDLLFDNDGWCILCGYLGCGPEYKDEHGSKHSMFLQGAIASGYVPRRRGDRLTTAPFVEFVWAGNGTPLENIVAVLCWLSIEFDEARRDEMEAGAALCSTFEEFMSKVDWDSGLYPEEASSYLQQRYC